MLRESECTSCQFDDDKSAYWTPSLHFVHEGGKTEIVPQVGGMLAYYLLLALWNSRGALGRIQTQLRVHPRHNHHCDTNI